MVKWISRIVYESWMLPHKNAKTKRVNSIHRVILDIDPVETFRLQANIGFNIGNLSRIWPLCKRA
jgi:hypothetical protein